MEIKRLIENSQFAISTEETRYYLNGIYLHTVDVSGRRCCARSRPTGMARARRDRRRRKARSACPGVIAPRKAVGEILKLLEDPRQDVPIEISTAKARFRFGDVVLTTKLIDGTFPDYARVIPTNNDKRLVVDKEPFERAVDRSSTLSSERGRAIKLAIAEGKMTLSVNNPDFGSASEEIEADYDSAPIDIGFNSRYLLDIVGQLSSDTALIRLADPGSPTLIQDREGAPALYRADAAQGLKGEILNVFQWLRYGPWLAQVVVTRRCNLKCGYCTEYDRTSDPVPYEELALRLAKLAELRAWAVCLTGGEPTMHPRLPDLVAEMKRLGFKRRMMITNGWRLTPPSSTPSTALASPTCRSAWTGSIRTKSPRRP